NVTGVQTCALPILVAPLVEQSFQALVGGDPEMVVALGADVGVPEDFLLIDDLLAAVALDPQPLGHPELLPLHRLLGLLDLLEPGHRHCWGAPGGRSDSSDSSKRPTATSKPV